MRPLALLRAVDAEHPARDRHRVAGLERLGHVHANASARLHRRARHQAAAAHREVGEHGAARLQAGAKADLEAHGHAGLATALLATVEAAQQEQPQRLGVDRSPHQVVEAALAELSSRRVGESSLTTDQPHADRRPARRGPTLLDRLDAARRRDQQVRGRRRAIDDGAAAHARERDAAPISSSTPWMSSSSPSSSNRTDGPLAMAPLAAFAHSPSTDRAAIPGRRRAAGGMRTVCRAASPAGAPGSGPPRPGRPRPGRPPTSAESGVTWRSEGDHGDAHRRQVVRRVAEHRGSRAVRPPGHEPEIAGPAPWRRQRVNGLDVQGSEEERGPAGSPPADPGGARRRAAPARGTGAPPRRRAPGPARPARARRWLPTRRGACAAAAPRALSSLIQVGELEGAVERVAGAQGARPPAPTISHARRRPARQAQGVGRGRR